MKSNPKTSDGERKSAKGKEKKREKKECGLVGAISDSCRDSLVREFEHESFWTSFEVSTALGNLNQSKAEIWMIGGFFANCHENGRNSSLSLF